MQSLERAPYGSKTITVKYPCPPLLAVPKRRNRLESRLFELDISELVKGPVGVRFPFGSRIAFELSRSDLPERGIPGNPWCWSCPTIPGWTAHLWEKQFMHESEPKPIDVVISERQCDRRNVA